MNKDMLETMLDNLRTFRADAEFYKTEKSKIIDAIKESQNYVLADTKQNEAVTFAAGLEAEIKKIAVELDRDGVELPERVKVKMFTVISEYDKTAAREWCFMNFRPALMLDEKTFEKAVKDGNIPADLATVIKEARAQIATKL